MRFVYPYLLLLLTLLPVVGLFWIWLQRRAERRMALLIAPSLQAKLMPSSGTTRFFIQFTLILTGFALLLIAAARPQWGRKDEKVVARGRNLVIALDVSRSMLATDVHPNRLERAKTDLMDLIDDLSGDRAALLAFRQKGSLLCPLTTDYAFLRQALDGTSPESAPRGETDLGDAIRKSLAALDPAMDEYNAILMISDGEDLKGDAIAAAKEAASRNVPIFTVGIGDPSGASIPDPDGKGMQQYKGTTVKTRLMDKTLTAIADASHGRYIPFGTASTASTTLGAIYRRHLKRIAVREQQDLVRNRLQERYQLFLYPALFLLLAAGCFSRGRMSGSSRRAIATALLLFVTPALFGAEAESVEAPTSTNTPPAIVVAPGREGARTAQRFFKKGEYAKAAEAYLSALRGADREEGETYRYNAALAWYLAKNPEKAAETIRPLLDSRPMRSRAGELLGKLQMEQAQKFGAEDPEKRAETMEEAALAFQHTLRDQPEEERRFRNFARATSALPETRDAAHIAKVLKEHEKTQMPQLISQLLTGQRELMADADSVYTNAPAQMIAEAEALAKRQEALTDLWIPLKRQLLQAVTNEQAQAQMNQQIELLRDMMKGTATAWQDLLPDAVSATAQPEPALYSLWKGTAQPDAILNEEILCQSNAIQNLRLAHYRNRDTQKEAAALSPLFLERFPQWAEGYRQQAQADTNLPPFTAETQQKIEKLIQHAHKLQQEVAEQPQSDPEKTRLQKQALQDLYEAQALMPKQNNNQNQQQQQQQQQQNQQQQQQQQNQEQQKQEQKKENKPEQNEKKETPPKDVQELLRRALNREKEHEEEKKERMRKIPLSPMERDW